MSEPASPAPPPALTERQTSGGLFVTWNGVGLVVGLLALAGGLALARPWSPARGLSAFEPSRPWDPAGFAQDAVWDDGLAEVARYDAVRTVYGEQQAYELVRVAVEESFDPRFGVRPADDARGLPAFRTLASHATPTHRPYVYQQTVVVHLSRRDPRVVLGATMGSQEWNGVTYVELTRTAAGWLRRVAHSYFEGEGDRVDRLVGDAWLEDQLPFLVRALPLEAGARHEVKLLPSLLSNRAPREAAAPAVVTVGAPEELTVAAGTFRCAPITVTREDGSPPLRYWVALEGARPLVRYEDSSGAGSLRTLERTAYWEDPR